MDVFWPVFGILVVSCLISWFYLRSAGIINRHGHGLFDAWKAKNTLVRRMARIAVLAVVSMFALYFAIDCSTWLYGLVTNLVVQCAPVPTLWTPAIIFTAILIIGIVVRLVYPIPRFSDAFWALLALAVGFHLATWEAPLLAVVWIPVFLAALPIIVKAVQDRVIREDGWWEPPATERDSSET